MRYSKINKTCYQKRNVSVHDSLGNHGKSSGKCSQLHSTQIGPIGAKYMIANGSPQT